MNKLRVSAKTVNDAITEASIELGLPSTEFEYEVIEEGSKGFLGIGSKQAVIEVWKKADKEEKKEKKERKSEKKFEKKEVKKEFKEEKKVIKEEEKAEKVVEDTAEKVSEKREEKLAKVEDVTIEACKNFLQNVLDTMNMKVEITTSIDEDGALCIDMAGDDMGILIGKRGQTLDSLQYLTNRVANKMQDGYVRVKLDTENYRARRKETLENLAKNLAHKVKRTNKSVSLEPMNPYERRIIHSVLQADKYVSTHSEGEEPYRRVVITLTRR